MTLMMSCSELKMLVLKRYIYKVSNCNCRKKPAIL